MVSSSPLRISPNRLDNPQDLEWSDPLQIFKYQPLSTLSLSNSRAASQAFFLFSKHAKLISASGPLHLFLRIPRPHTPHLYTAGSFLSFRPQVTCLFLSERSLSHHNNLWCPLCPQLSIKLGCFIFFIAHLSPLEVVSLIICLLSSLQNHQLHERGTLASLLYC